MDSDGERSENMSEDLSSLEADPRNTNLWREEYFIQLIS